ncbi:MAG: hypothetical protein LBB26_00990 [Puniceicoccales bacterium]|nr:hypothetical protein [Puniceicoccales bacterium]
MITNQRVIHVEASGSAAFWKNVGLQGLESGTTSTDVLLNVATKAGGAAKPAPYLVRFVATGGMAADAAVGGFGADPVIAVLDGVDPCWLAAKWMLHHGYTDPAVGRALELMEPSKIAFYDGGGSAVPLEKVSGRLGDITHVCLCNSNDGKSTVFAVTDVEILRQALRKRSGGNKVTFAFLKKDSPEISNSEVAAQENKWQKFFQMLTGSCFTTASSALVTLLGILITAAITGNAMPLSAILVSVITFIIFTALGLFSHARV